MNCGGSGGGCALLYSLSFTSMPYGWAVIKTETRTEPWKMFYKHENNNKWWYLITLNVYTHSPTHLVNRNFFPFLCGVSFSSSHFFRILCCFFFMWFAFYDKIFYSWKVTHCYKCRRYYLGMDEWKVCQGKSHVSNCISTGGKNAACFTTKMFSQKNKYQIEIDEHQHFGRLNVYSWSV